MDKKYNNVHPSEPVKETHFFKIEGILGRANIRESFWNFKRIISLLTPDPANPVEDWTVVDFDGYLKGNPHLPGLKTF